MHLLTRAPPPTKAHLWGSHLVLQPKVQHRSTVATRVLSQSLQAASASAGSTTLPTRSLSESHSTVPFRHWHPTRLGASRAHLISHCLHLHFWLSDSHAGSTQVSCRCMHMGWTPASGPGTQCRQCSVQHQTCNAGISGSLSVNSILVLWTRLHNVACIATGDDVSWDPWWRLLPLGSQVFKWKQFKYAGSGLRTGKRDTG